MKNYLKFFSVFMLLLLYANQSYAQIKHGDATVIQGSTVTVSLGSAYQRTLDQATGVSYTWTAGSSAISIQSRTSKTCTIKGNTVGTAKLNYHCSYYIDGFYRTMDLYYDITINSNTIYVTRIEMSPSSATLEIGETLQLSATAYPTNATNRSLNWTTENYSVASVSSNGLVTARGAGRVWVWARATDGSGAGNYCVIDVNEPAKVTSIDLSETKKELTVGEKFELVATVFPENAYNKNLTWTSENEAVAIVSNGEVTAIGAGECDVICESSDGSNVSAVCLITVHEPEQYWLSVIVPNGDFAINVTDMDNVNLQITPDNGYSINSITLNGEECQHDNGRIVLPKLSQNSTLNIVFEAEVVTGIESMGEDPGQVKVIVSNHTVSIKGLSESQKVLIYDIQGILMRTETDDTFELPRAGVYILRIGEKSFKLAIQ